MGLDPEYSVSTVCPVDDCGASLQYIVHVQWTPFDFLDDVCCADHLAFIENYWSHSTVDDIEPEIDVDFIWNADL